MRSEIHIINPCAGAGDATRFWRRAFAVYAAAEALFLIISYMVTAAQCKQCVLPLPFYGWQYLANLLLTALLWYGLNSFYGLALWKIIAGNILIFLLYYFLYNGMLYTVLNSGRDWLVGAGARYRSFESIVYASWFDIGKYVLKLSAFYALKFYAAFLRSSQQRLELAVINKDLQLNLLKQQLNPHFYFNTLNNLYGLSRNNSPRLSVALNQLSSIMQYVIADCNNPRVLLRQEIDFLRSYIELEKLRYEKDTIIEFTVEGEAREQNIAPLLLIQFVENAFKHGMKEKQKDDWLKVFVKAEGREVLFRVDNSYGDSLPAEGIGISSVKNMLELQYPGKHVLEMQHKDYCFSVTLKLSL